MASEIRNIDSRRKSKKASVARSGMSERERVRESSRKKGRASDGGEL